MLVPAAVHADYQIKGSPPGSVSIRQTSDQGKLSVGIGGGQLEVSDGAGPTVLPGLPRNIKVRMLPVQGDLEIDLDQTLPGNLDLQIEDTQFVNFIGSTNEIGGSLKIKGKEGAQTINISQAGSLLVAKNLTIDLGAGDDVIEDNDEAFQVQGNAKFVGVNHFEIGMAGWIGKNLLWNAKKEQLPSVLENTMTLQIGGSLKFVGGDGRDQLILNGAYAGVDIGKNLIADLRDGPNAGPQIITLGNPFRCEGNVKLKARGEDGTSLNSQAGTEFGKNLSVQFKGPGTNVVFLVGVLDGKSVKYQGGDGFDDPRIDLVAPLAKVLIKMGAGNDMLGFYKNQTDLKSLTVDGGKGEFDAVITDFLLPPPFPYKQKNVEAGP